MYSDFEKKKYKRENLERNWRENKWKNRKRWMFISI